MRCPIIATRQGVLFKGGKALETAGRMNILAFDKTGTLTQGLPKVSKFVSLGETTSRQVLLIAASLEQQSEHPLAKAIVALAKEQEIELQTPDSFTALPGKGIEAKLGKSVYFVGNRRLFAEYFWVCWVSSCCISGYRNFPAGNGEWDEAF